MNILIVAATSLEIAIFTHFLSERARIVSPYQYKLGRTDLQLLVTGVGSVATACRVSEILSKNHFSIAVNAGIAGAFSKDLPLGTMVHVVSDRLGDAGAEMADSAFRDTFELDLDDPNGFPFQGGWLADTFESESPSFKTLPKVKAITVNTVAGTAPTIQTRVSKYQPDIETMEGAAFFYACHVFQQPALQVRAVSNAVEIRNRDNWNIPLAVKNLNAWLIDFVSQYA